MNFKRDILLIDTEFSGFDVPKKHDLLQIAAVLLDKKTLKEKKFLELVKDEINVKEIFFDGKIVQGKN